MVACSGPTADYRYRNFASTISHMLPSVKLHEEYPLILHLIPSFPSCTWERNCLRSCASQPRSQTTPSSPTPPRKHRFLPLNPALFRLVPKLYLGTQLLAKLCFALPAILPLLRPCAYRRHSPRVSVANSPLAEGLTRRIRSKPRQSAAIQTSAFPSTTWERD